MGFCDRYIHSLHSTDLRDDEFHHMTDALQAASWANGVSRGIGSLLARVKYASTLGRQFEDRPEVLAKLIREWHAIVAEKGAARKWIKTEDIPTIGHLAPAMYKRVADASLAHYLDGKCVECRGSKVSIHRTICGACKGSGDATIVGLGNLETKYAMDMVSELMSLESSHSGAANKLLWREE
jgi:hypothetical protein